MALFSFLQKPQPKLEAKTATPRKGKAVPAEVITAQILAQRDSLRRNGFKRYAFVANGGCCPDCADLNGKTFALSRLKCGTNAPPMHEGCRCSICAYESDVDYEAWLNRL
jgi:SPP1 gp7 family putative phage head morphogenesis protein